MRNTSILICPQTDACPVYKNWHDLLKKDFPNRNFKKRVDIVIYNPKEGAYECEALKSGFFMGTLAEMEIAERNENVDAECLLIKMINDTNRIKSQFDKEVYSR